MTKNINHEFIFLKNTFFHSFIFILAICFSMVSQIVWEGGPNKGVKIKMSNPNFESARGAN